MTTTRGRCLSVVEASAYLGISRSAMYRLAAECRAELPVVHVTPGRRAFRERDLDAYLEKRTVGRRRTA